MSTTPSEFGPKKNNFLNQNRIWILNSNSQFAKYVPESRFKRYRASRHSNKIYLYEECMNMKISLNAWKKNSLKVILLDRTRYDDWLIHYHLTFYGNFSATFFYCLTFCSLSSHYNSFCWHAFLPFVKHIFFRIEIHLQVKASLKQLYCCRNI